MHVPRLLRALAALALLAGCTVIQGENPELFDLGMQREAVALPADLLGGRTVSVAGIDAPAWLDSERMYYRLDYANAQQPRPYALSRWSMAPGQLLAQRARQAIAQAGAIALAAADAAPGVPTLHVQLDDFSQHFSAPGVSTGRIALRATLFERRRVIAQRSFVREVPAATANAAGGARALAEASDAVLADLLAWLATLPQR